MISSKTSSLEFATIPHFRRLVGIDIEKEYEKIKNKSSSLPRAMRDMVVERWIFEQKVTEEMNAEAIQHNVQAV